MPMNDLDLIIKVAARPHSDGFLTSYMRDREGVDVDLNNVPRPSVREFLRQEVPAFAQAIPSMMPGMYAQGARVLGNLAHIKGRPFETGYGPAGDYARWFNDHVGDPSKSFVKDLAYRLTSGGGGHGLGETGIGPALMDVYRKFSPR